MLRTLKVILVAVAILWAGGLAYEALTGQLGKATEAPHVDGGCLVAGRRSLC